MIKGRLSGPIVNPRSGRYNMLKRLVKALARWAESRGKMYEITGRDKDDNDVYMIRYILVKTKYFAIYIHKFLRSDDDIYHDHPWHFMTYIADGAYTEKLLQQDTYEWKESTRRLSSGSVVFRLSTHKHIVKLDRDYSADEDSPLTISLIGPRHREWGFWPKNEYGKHSFVPWRNYLGLPKDYVNLQRKDLMEP